MYMTFNMIILLILNSFFIIGLNRATHFDTFAGEVIPESRQVLWFLRFYLVKFIGEYLTKPFFSCVACMASIHSIIPFVYYASLNDIPWYFIFAYIPTLSGVTIFINSLIVD